MKKNNGGYMILECILGTVVLSGAFLIALQTASVQRHFGGHQSTKINAHKVLRQFQNNFESGMNHEVAICKGIFSNGQPYEVELGMDVIASPPLEKAIIQISWNDLTTNKYHQIEGNALRIR